MLWIIVLVSAGLIAVLAWISLQMVPEIQARRKKAKRQPPPEPPRDWQAIAERAEKRVKTMDDRIRQTESVVRDKDKEIAELRNVITGLERQYEQEQVWRKREEENVEKEKKTEKLLNGELQKARESLNAESTARIKMEYEVKEARQARESISADFRRMQSAHLELERKHRDLIEESRNLKVENAKLKEKKEADQWVAKDDYVKVTKTLKHLQWEVEQFKKKFPKEMWPASLLPKDAVPPVSRPETLPPAPPANPS